MVEVGEQSWRSCKGIKYFLWGFSAYPARSCPSVPLSALHPIPWLHCHTASRGPAFLATVVGGQCELTEMCGLSFHFPTKSVVQRPR